MNARRGSASGGAPLRCAAFALLLAGLAMARGAGAATPAAAPAPLAFSGLAWDAPPADVARALAVRHFVRGSEGGEVVWRGVAFGRRARLEPETDAAGRLVAVTLRFDADRRGSALQRYAELADALGRTHGAPTAEVAPGRPVDEERWGRHGGIRRFGPRTAATLWTDAAGAGAVVQLDGEGVLWLRYESPRWESARRGVVDAPR